MVCQFHVYDHPEFIAILSINIIGIILTLLSIVCLLANTKIDRSVRGILLSFLTANIIGIAMLTCDTIALICYPGGQKLGLIVTVSVTLSLSHLMLLLLAEYIILTSSSRRSGSDFTGLITLSWIISLSIGSVNVITVQPRTRIAFATLFILSVIFILLTYINVIQKERKRTRLQELYKLNYLHKDCVMSHVVKRNWKLKFFAVILLVYVACSLPWVVNEFQEGSGKKLFQPLDQSILLIIYSLNFFSSPFICMYLWCNEQMARRNPKTDSMQVSYGTVIE